MSCLSSSQGRRYIYYEKPLQENIYVLCKATKRTYIYYVKPLKDNVLPVQFAGAHNRKTNAWGSCVYVGIQRGGLVLSSPLLQDTEA